MVQFFFGSVANIVGKQENAILTMFSKGFFPNSRIIKSPVP